MAITFDIITLLSLGFSKFSCGDYVISKMADIGTGKLWEEIKKRIPKNEESLESQLYDAIEASLKQYAYLGYNSDQIAAACEIIFGMWIKEGHLSEEYVKKALGYLNVRRHIVVGANRILFSVYPPTRLCRIGTYRRFKAERPHTVVVLFQGQISCF